MILKRFEQGRFRLLLQEDGGEEWVVLIRDNEVQCAVKPEEVSDLHSVAWSMLDAIENDDWRKPAEAP